MAVPTVALTVWLDGLTEGDPNVNKELAALVPPKVVTKTLAAPADPAGVVQVMEVAVLERKEAQAVPPMVTPVALLKLAPVIVTLVPPVMVPKSGLMAVTCGGK